MKENKNIFKLILNNSSYFVVSHKYEDNCMNNTYIEILEDILSIVTEDDTLDCLNDILIRDTCVLDTVTNEELDKVSYFLRNRELGLKEKLILYHSDLELSISHTFELLGDLFAIVHYPDIDINNITIITLHNDSSINGFFSINYNSISINRLNCIVETLINLSPNNITYYAFDSDTFICIFKPTNNISFISIILSDEDYFSEDKFLFFRTVDDESWDNVTDNITDFLDHLSIKYYLSYTNIFIDNLYKNIYGGE